MLCLEVFVGLCVCSESVACAAALQAQIRKKRTASETEKPVPKPAEPKGAPTAQNMFCIIAERFVHSCMQNMFYVFCACVCCQSNTEHVLNSVM
jgi:hypothetical protein